MKACLSPINSGFIVSLISSGWRRLAIILLIWGGFTSRAPAQVKQWDKTLGGIKTETNDYDVQGWSRLTAMVATPDGGHLLGGSSDSKIGGDKSEVNRGILPLLPMLPTRMIIGS